MMYLIALHNLEIFGTNGSALIGGQELKVLSVNSDYQCILA